VIEEARATSDLLKIKIKQRSQRPYEGLGTNDIQDLAIEEKEKKFIVVSDDVGNKIADPEQ
jgi:tartrate dehydratase beta subunit/fumarate hydratase class I family protein